MRLLTLLEKNSKVYKKYSFENSLNACKFLEKFEKQIKKIIETVEIPHFENSIKENQELSKSNNNLMHALEQNTRQAELIIKNLKDILNCKNDIENFKAVSMSYMYFLKMGYRI